MKEGMKWQPERLDDLLEEPFAEIERQVQAEMTVRLDQMLSRLDDIEVELDEFLEQQKMSVI